LTAAGGNPNLFWDPAACELLVLDHNQAFDPDFDPADFRDFHAFAARIPELFDNRERRDAFVQRLELALALWEQIVASIPAAWHFADSEMTVPADFDIDAALSTLRRCRSQEFWTLP
jgi:hypothetical protein